MACRRGSSWRPKNCVSSFWTGSDLAWRLPGPPAGCSRRRRIRRKTFRLSPSGRESLGLYPVFVAAVEEASGRSVGFARPGTLEIFFAPHGEVERDKWWPSIAVGPAAEPGSLGDARKFESGLIESARAAAWLPEECTVEPRMLMDAVLRRPGSAAWKYVRIAA